MTSPPPTQTLADRLRRPSETRVHGQDVDKPTDEEEPSSATTLDTWVTVYGFQPSEAAVVMRTFQTMGEVVDFGRYGPARSNWMHIRYRTRQGAQRALAQDGKQISEGLLVGVKPLNEEEAQRIVSERGEGGGSVRFAPQVPSAWSRPYRIDGDPKADGLPRPVHSTWEKITECIFGL